MNNSPFVTVSNIAVMTVLKCLGLPEYEYERCRLVYRSLRWLDMPWYMNQYSGLLETEVRPYFKNKHKG